MSNQLKTSIILDLGGNLASKAGQFSSQFQKMAAVSEASMGRIQRVTSKTAQLLDSSANRYVAATSAWLTGKAVNDVADMESRLTRLKTNTMMTKDKLDELKHEVMGIANDPNLKVDFNELLGAYETAKARGLTNEAAREMLRPMALLMQGTGATGTDAGFFASYLASLGADGKEATKVLDTMIVQLDEGQARLDKISQQMPAFSQIDIRSVEEYSKALAMFHIFNIPLKNEDEAKTSFLAFNRTWKEPDKALKMQRLLGVAVKDDKGRNRSDMEISEDLLKAALRLGDNWRFRFNQAGFDSTALAGFSGMFAGQGEKRGDKIYQRISPLTEKHGLIESAAKENAETFNSTMNVFKNRMLAFAENTLQKPLKNVTELLSTADDSTFNAIMGTAIAGAGVLGGWGVFRSGQKLYQTATDIWKGPAGEPAAGRGAPGAQAGKPTAPAPRAGFAGLGGTPQKAVERTLTQRVMGSGAARVMLPFLGPLLPLWEAYIAKETGDALGNMTVDWLAQTKGGNAAFQWREDFEKNHPLGNEDVPVSIVSAFEQLLGRITASPEISPAKEQPINVEVENHFTLEGFAQKTLQVQQSSTIVKARGKEQIYNGPMMDPFGG